MQVALLQKFASFAHLSTEHTYILCLMASFRLASTDDCRDGVAHLVSGSTHYLNVFDDSGWRFSDESHSEPMLHNILAVAHNKTHPVAALSIVPARCDT